MKCSVLGHPAAASVANHIAARPVDSLRKSAMGVLRAPGPFTSLLFTFSVHAVCFLPVPIILAKLYNASNCKPSRWHW